MTVAGLALLFASTVGSGPDPRPAPGVLLEDLTWIEAEKALTPEAVVVIPLGAQSKEHGPHLRLKNDFILAEYLKKRVLEEAAVVVAPTVNYGFYPAFVEYPGATSLTLETVARHDRRDLPRPRAVRPEAVLRAEHRRLDDPRARARRSRSWRPRGS